MHRVLPLWVVSSRAGRYRDMEFSCHGLSLPACAMALIPLVAVILGVRLIVKLTSYITVPGRILGSMLIIFCPSSVSPRIDVISEPAYVVGMQI